MQRLANEGADYSQFIRDLLRHLRQLFLLQHLEEAAERRGLPARPRPDGRARRPAAPRACCRRPTSSAPREVVHFIETLGEAQREIRDGLDPRLQLELALVKVTRPQLDHSAAALEERLRRLEAGAAGAGRRGAAAGGRAARGRRGRQAGRRRQPQPATPATAAPPAERRPTAAAAAASPAAAGSRRAAAGRPPSPPAQELTLERVKRAWELILQRVQASSVPPLRACCATRRPAALEDDAPHRRRMPSDFALTRAREAGNAELLAGAVEAALGRAAAARVRAGARRPAAPAHAPSRPPQPQSTATSPTSIRAARRPHSTPRSCPTSS